MFHGTVHRLINPENRLNPSSQTSTTGRSRSNISRSKHRIKCIFGVVVLTLLVSTVSIIIKMESSLENSRIRQDETSSSYNEVENNIPAKKLSRKKQKKLKEAELYGGNTQNVK